MPCCRTTWSGFSGFCRRDRPDVSVGCLLTVYLAAITPACATITSMAQLYECDAAYSSSLYVLTTIFSIVTMPLMVFLYEVI